MLHFLNKVHFFPSHAEENTMEKPNTNEKIMEFINKKLRINTLLSLLKLL